MSRTTKQGVELNRKQMGQQIYARLIVSVGWLPCLVSMLFGCIVLVTLSTMSYNKRLHNTTYGFSLLFLSGLKSITLMASTGMFFRNVDTRACFRCCLNEGRSSSGSNRSGGSGGSGGGGGGNR